MGSLLLVLKKGEYGGKNLKFMSQLIPVRPVVFHIHDVQYHSEAQFSSEHRTSKLSNLKPRQYLNWGNVSMRCRKHPQTRLFLYRSPNEYQITNIWLDPQEILLLPRYSQFDFKQPLLVPSVTHTQLSLGPGPSFQLYGPCQPESSLSLYQQTHTKWVLCRSHCSKSANCQTLKLGPEVFTATLSYMH